MSNRVVRLLGFASVVLTLFVSSATPSSAQEAPDLQGQALAAADRVDGDKAPTSRLAQTDEALLARRDAAPAFVMIKLDYDSVATYQGGVDGLAATSPTVTGEALTGTSRAEQAYGSYLDSKRGAVVAELQRAVPEIQVGSTFNVVYGGFSAVIPANKTADVLAVDGVVAVQENKLNKPLTDASGDFIGAPTIYDQLGGVANAGEGTILGNLDTGIWPEHPSFADLGNLSAPPAPPGGGTRECNYGDNPLTPAVDVFACQNKLIGGAHFTDDYDTFVGDDPLEGTARDSDGHGTHTSSTSAGNPVASVPVLGTDRGPIAGLAPGAWVMEYKVCGPQGCFDSDSAAAVEQAVLDGVDVINFSISGGTQPFSDPVELAFLDAYAAGVFVSASAGNAGPGASTANHLGPWTTTVAASTQTREFATTLTLTADNGDTFTSDGASITQGVDTATPVVLASDPPYSDALCTTAAPAGLFTGKLVACERGGNPRVHKGFNVLQGGAVGMVLYNPTLADIETDNHWLPTVHLADGTDLLAFMGGHTGVTGSFPDATKRDGQGDVMAAFSSRGPAGLVIKPDVTAPGVQILAGDTPFPGDPAAGSGPPGETFQAIAGTSMSSPHVAGSGLLLAALHPEWTPGQIKSALMTTATTDVVKEDLTTPADPFDMGSGRIDLTVAGSTPLSLDETADRFFALGADPANAVHLNLPSVNAPIMPGRVDTTRTVENISGRTQRFTVTTEAPAGATLSVTPRSFALEPGQKMTLNVSISAPVPETGAGPQAFGEINIVGRTGAVHLPVAWVPTQAGVNLTQSCTPNPVVRNHDTTCTVVASNNSAEDTVVDLFTEVSGGLRITGASGATVTTPKTAQRLDVPLAGRRPGIPAVDPGSLFGYIPLDSFGIPPIAVGDEEIVNFNVPAFEYAGGTWTRVGVTSNGYLVVGGGTSEDVNCCNIPSGPDPARPNNVLAPLWTDLDGTGAPGVFVGVLTDGVDSWIVLESRLNVFGTTDLQILQVWIGINGTEDVTYAYDPANLPSDPGMDFLVGAENLLGQGDMEAVLPTGDLRVVSSGSATGDQVSYSVTIRGTRLGTWPVKTSMVAEGVPGTTITTTNVTVIPSSGVS